MSSRYSWSYCCLRIPPLLLMVMQYVAVSYTYWLLVTFTNHDWWLFHLASHVLAVSEPKKQSRQWHWPPCETSGDIGTSVTIVRLRLLRHLSSSGVSLAYAPVDCDICHVLCDIIYWSRLPSVRCVAHGCHPVALVVLQLPGMSLASTLRH